RWLPDHSWLFPCFPRWRSAGDPRRAAGLSPAGVRWPRLALSDLPGAGQRGLGFLLVQAGVGVLEVGQGAGALGQEPEPDQLAAAGQRGNRPLGPPPALGGAPW